MDCLNLLQSQNLTKTEFLMYVLVVIFGGYIIAIIVTLIAGRIILGKTNDKKENKEQNYDYFETLYKKNIKPWAFTLNMFLTALRAGITEELFFRFFLMKYLFIEKMKLSPIVAIIVSSIIFGSAHIGNSIADPESNYKIASVQAINAGIGGLLDGYVYWKSGNIFITMIGHFMYDLILMLLQASAYYSYYKKRKEGKITNKNQDIKLFSPRVPQLIF